MVNWDRQTSASLEGICAGHLNRYHFAAKKAKDFILDAACGCGYGSSLLHKVGDVTGIDLEPEAIKFASEHYPGPQYLVSDVTTHDGSYDWVVSFETLEHLPDPVSALKNFRKISGNLIISTPNQKHYAFKPENYKESVYPHLRHYTPQELDDILIGTGWTVIERHCQVKKSSPVLPGTEGMFIIYLCR